MTLAAPSRLTAPSLPLAVAFAIAPAASVLQSRAIAPIATIALALCILAHRRRTGAWPWPRGAAFRAAIALLAWAALTALWAIEPLRALGTPLQIGGFVVLGAMAARAMTEEDEAARHRLLLAAAGGLVAGLALAGLDLGTGHAVRAAVRGLREPTPMLAFGLKPAASAMGLWLPLVAAAGIAAWLRGTVLLAGAALLVLLPGEAAKIAVLAGGLAGGLALLAPRLVPRLLGAALALSILAMPVALGPVLARGLPADGIPPSAAHRLLIWDFVTDRIAERPILGWGMESSRAIPGHRDHPAPEALDRFRLAGPGTPPWLPVAQLLPLHPHNMALQIWLELGLPGALLAAALALLLGQAAARSRWPAVATAALAAATVTGMLSFGAWQEWWVGAELMALAAVAGLPRRG
ncbi:O-antigen ligase family protein [Roseicella aquatilis]|uniref:O-antigen ligase-related domain-containing protein n=1 Tax=Roseicella aquatilis TaxID=2527868 RepID=A0A4R4DGZ3_9PROT|nr:O-antigen ligase family protein [Roseicella aquatilis]TCZ59818.1 hypothetical protein EXY23_14515 [Roseicella aquatilis]